MKYAFDRFAGGGGLRTLAPAAVQAPAQTRLSGLDGLRAIAVLAVCLFHADVAWARGGYLGVDLFFVISGFLITGLLAGESEKRGRIGLARFYTRRAKRLLPASWAMTAAAVLAAFVLAPDALPRLRWDTVASLFYMTNWEMIAAQTSYFEAMGRPPLLQHLWSLAIEEQFYIVWAPLLYFALPRIGRRGAALGAGLLAAAGAVWMAVLAARLGYPDQGDPSRLYFGTDTHGFALLIGAVLGLLWRPERQTQSANPAEGEGVFALGLLALVAMTALFTRLGEETAWLYPWGFLLSAGVSVVLIAAATRRGSPFGRWLDTGVLRWIGERSYGIYLWHWPIFMLTRPDLDVRLDGTELFALRMGLTLGIAALSYRYLEMPIRQGAIERMWWALQASSLRPAALRQMRLALLAGGATLAAVAAILLLAPSRVGPSQDVRDALGLAAAAAAPAKPITAPSLPPIPAQAQAPGGFTGADLTAVGDSVLLGSSPLLIRMLPGAKVYATMGWQTASILGQIKTLAKAHALTPVVLVHLGTNGYATEAQLREILGLLAGAKRVILVNTHVPRRWMEANNDLIDEIAASYPNVAIADWRAVSEGQPDFFVSDGVHLTPAGQRMYVAEILRAGHLSAAAAARPIAPYTYAPGDLSPTLVRNPQPAAPDVFWQKMAVCETNANWTNVGRYGGGLGIDAGAWAAWGGTAFAPVPGGATPAQQIAVANRISTQGWTRPDGTRQAAAGYAAWRCTGIVGKPPMATRTTFTPQSVLAQRFHLSERGDVVRDLQAMLGLPRDGVYGKRVRAKHLKLLKAKGLPLELAGI
ncbi:MAG: acyltransferase family protein [Rhizomicrobium sp.]